MKRLKNILLKGKQMGNCSQNVILTHNLLESSTVFLDMQRRIQTDGVRVREKIKKEDQRIKLKARNRMILHRIDQNQFKGFVFYKKSEGKVFLCILLSG